MTPPADTGLPIEIKIYTGDNAAGETEVRAAGTGSPNSGLLLSRNGRNRGGAHGTRWSVECTCEKCLWLHGGTASRRN